MNNSSCAHTVNIKHITEKMFCFLFLFFYIEVVTFFVDSVTEFAFNSICADRAIKWHIK